MLDKLTRRLTNSNNSQAGVKYPHLDHMVIDINGYEELMKLFKWQHEPIIDRPEIHEYKYIEDLNQRRLRDEQSLAVIAANIDAKIGLEIGTAGGEGTALLAVNAPQSTIYTINLDPNDESVASGEAGELITYLPSKDEIGKAYRERGLKNIAQIYANTATWEPNIGTIDFAFIDGCHDTEFVINDTKKILPHMRPGGFIMWHDFNPQLAPKFNWIADVCAGVEQLAASGLISGRIFHIRDSWVGIYQVPNK
jgi:predicted O-methyltransferase YrrM